MIEGLVVVTAITTHHDLVTTSVTACVTAVTILVRTVTRTVMDRDFRAVTVMASRCRHGQRHGGLVRLCHLPRPCLDLACTVPRPGRVTVDPAPLGQGSGQGPGTVTLQVTASGRLDRGRTPLDRRS